MKMKYFKLMIELLDDVFDDVFDVFNIIFE